MFGDSKIKALYAEDDQRSLTDKRRQQHDIIKNEAGEWVLLRHADVKAAALDDDAFSSHVSRFLQIPNGLDGAEHDQYRALINRYLSQEAITPYVPLFQQVATELVSELPKGEVINAVTDIGTVFAVRAQCQWLGWPAEVEPILVQWVNDNHQASRLKDHAKLAAVAQDFNEIIRSVIAPFRDTYSAAASHNKANQDSITAQLCREQIKGRPLNEAEIVSILRNWTGVIWGLWHYVWA
nr:hypothetical protein [Psychrobacter sp. PraFG1]UNK06269.1 hypothetical protein MN210_06830 [Psychrobacter sp. PraFG1]